MSGSAEMFVDLGTPMDPGQNAIDADQVCVRDARSAQAPGPSEPIMTLSGTVLNGRIFAPGTVVTGAITNDPYYEIDFENNQISF